MSHPASAAGGSLSEARVKRGDRVVLHYLLGVVTAIAAGAILTWGINATVSGINIDTIGYIDRKELYELIENVVDRCDDVANAVQTVTAKHV